MPYNYYGHQCRLNPEPDLLHKHISGNDKCSKIRRWFIKQCMWHHWILRSKINLKSIKHYEQERNLHFRYKFIIHPFSLFRFYWTCITALLDASFLIFFPYNFSFLWHKNFKPDFKNFIVFFDVFAAIFFIDLLVKSRIAFYDKSRKIQMKAKDILRNNLAFMIICLFSSLPMCYDPHDSEVLKSNSKLTWVLMVALLRFLRIVPLLYNVTFLMNVLQITNFAIVVVQTTIVLIVYFFWATCISLVLGFISVDLHINDEPTMLSWLTDNDIWNTTRTMIFATSAYRIFTVHSNLNSSVIKYQTFSELLGMVLLWITSKTLYMFFFSVMLLVRRSATSSSAKYKEMILQLKQFMAFNQLSLKTQSLLIQYYEFRYQKTFFREQEILNLISGQLRHEILIMKCKEMVESVDIFKGLPQSLIMRFISLLQLEIFLTGDVVIESRTIGTSMYFISSGTISVYSISGKEIYHLEDGSYFGEIELIMPNKLRIASYVAIEPCELFRLERADFIHAISPFPELLQRLEDIAAERDQHISYLDQKNRLNLENRQQKSKRY